MENKKEDIWKRIDKKKEDECWNWLGCLNQTGYGHVRINKKLYRCHRIVYELINGSIPNGLCVLHTCDNPPCCNPNHLFLGTMKDNSNDMVKKGRSYHPNHKGELNKASKLTNDLVKEIRTLYATGNYTCKQLGIMYNVSHGSIGLIILRKTWNHI